MKKNYFKRFFADTKKYFKYSVEASKSALKAEVADSFLNWIWWILEPFCFMLVYWFVFAVLFNAQAQYFPAFIFLGITLWDFFSRMLKSSVSIVKGNKGTISRIYLPKHILIYTKLGQNGFKMLIGLAITAVLMVVYQVNVTPRMFFIVPILVLLILFSFGCSCFLLHFGVYVSDLNNITDIVLKIWFFLSGIMYDLQSRLGATWGRIIVNVNPMAYILTSARNVLLYGKMVSIRMLAFWYAVALLLCIFGVMLIYKNENSYVKSI